MCLDKVRRRGFDRKREDSSSAEKTREETEKGVRGQNSPTTRNWNMSVLSERRENE